jgi:hypothetical protein
MSRMVGVEAEGRLFLGVSAAQHVWNGVKSAVLAACR